jgi:hypothetical protein
MEKLIPVVDGDEGADIYGYARNETEALTFCGGFADPVVRIERYGPIHLSDGRTLPEAFVAITSAWGGAGR